MMNKIKVLLFATSQFELAYIRLGEEVREIEERVQAGSYRDSFEFITRSAVRISDLETLLLKHKPHIVHFSGHGRPTEGITFEDDSGQIKHVDARGLSGILRTLRDSARLAFFNVCYSKAHAEAVAQVIDYAIGMDGAIEDESAIVFASCFYQALAFGRSVGEAFDVAKEGLNIRGLPGADIPVLLVRVGVDDSEVFLQREESINGIESTLRDLVDGIANEDDRLTMRHGVINGDVVLDEVENNAINGSNNGRIFDVVVRDHQTHVRLNPTAHALVRARLFPPPPGMPPPFPNSVFIGREGALEDIKRLLNERKGNDNIIVVRGWPGVGKTTLVGVIARDPDIQRLFADGVLWTSLEQRPNLLAEIARWGRALGTDEILRAPTLKDASAQLTGLLRHRRMLLIVDDVWDTAHAVPFMEAMGEHCALLVTTRMTSVAQSLTNNEERVYNLPVLAEEAALKLLRTIVPSILEQYQEECRSLVHDLECLPLALQVAGELLRSEANMGWGLTDLINEIREGSKLTTEPAPGDRMEGEKIPTVSTLLMKSTDKLDDLSRDCFAYLGAFAPKPATFDLSAMKAVWEMDDPRPIVRKLVGHGLLEPTQSGRFQMHRLLVDHAISLCEE